MHNLWQLVHREAVMAVAAAAVAPAVGIAEMYIACGATALQNAAV
jgi:hypothetical protein